MGPVHSVLGPAHGVLGILSVLLLFREYLSRDDVSMIHETFDWLASYAESHSFPTTYERSFQSSELVQVNA